MTKITWLGHASWLIEAGGKRVLLDPFLTDNPVATASPDEFDDVSEILVSHGHFDHVGDAAEIAKRSGAKLIANWEVAGWFASKHGVENYLQMNIGGTTELSIGTVKFTPAVHSSGLPDGTDGGSPVGMILTIEGKRIYFACDTGVFSDMRLYAHGVDLAVLPIGDLFTMGIDDSITAINLIEPKSVIPAHYNTMPPIEQDANAWAERVRSETKSAPVVLSVNEAHSL